MGSGSAAPAGVDRSITRESWPVVVDAGAAPSATEPVAGRARAATRALEERHRRFSGRGRRVTQPSQSAGPGSRAGTAIASPGSVSPGSASAGSAPGVGFAASAPGVRLLDGLARFVSPRSASSGFGSASSSAPRRAADGGRSSERVWRCPYATPDPRPHSSSGWRIAGTSRPRSRARASNAGRGRHFSRLFGRGRPRAAPRTACAVRRASARKSKSRRLSTDQPVPDLVGCRDPRWTGCCLVDPPMEPAATTSARPGAGRT